MSPIITLDELIQSLRDAEVANPENDGYYSTRELERIWGLSKGAVTKLLGQANERGRLSISYRRSTRIDGRCSNTPCYKISALEKPDKSRRVARKPT